MYKRAWFLLGVVLAFLLPGCGSSDGVPEGQPEVQAEEPVEDPGINPDDSANLNLANLLDRPRAELAALCDAWTGKVHRQQTLYEAGHAEFALLPETRLPLALPVWRQARLSAQAGVSLPPYLAEGAHDAVLALHLARYGDAEAARKVVDPADAATLKQIDALQLPRNYPVEWTRLAGLMLHSAAFRVATGEMQGAVDMGELHQQIRSVLDPRSQKGPLGAALLPRGREVLRRGAVAWRKSRPDEVAAKAADEALAAWGPVPPLTLPLNAGASRAEVARLLGGTGQGLALLAPVPARALDLLGLPLPEEGVEAVVASFDTGDRLTEILAAYRPQAAKEYRGPAQLGLLLEDDLPGKDLAGVLPQRLYRAPGFRCDVVVVPHSRAAGALARITGPYTGRAPELARDLGAVHLNRSYTENRLALAPRQAGGRATVRDALALGRCRLPWQPAQLAEVVLDREATADAVARLTLRQASAKGRQPLAEVALPLWQAAGAGRVGLSGSGDAARLALSWEDAKTRYVLCLPGVEGEAPELEIADRTEGISVGERAERARAWDLQERRARMEGQRPLTRLPRDLEQVKLGATRAEVLEGLPAEENVLKRELPRGLLVTFSSPTEEANPIPRELFVRFDGKGRVAEVRVHYTDLPGKASGTKRFLESLKARAGAPRELPPPGPSPARGWQQWEDDGTLLACRPGGGLDVLLRDRPADQDTTAAPPARYLPRGPEGCALGTSREELFRRWKVRQAPPAGEPLVLTPPELSPYDAVLVWLEKGQVRRVVARHRTEDADGQPSQAAKGVAEAWGQEAATLGWPRQQELTRQGEVQSWANHDDVTRVRIFWQQNRRETPRLYTEWTETAR
jgi:hypothetical protein